MNIQFNRRISTWLIVLSLVFFFMLASVSIISSAYLVTQRTFTPEQEKYLKEWYYGDDSESVQVIYYERRIQFSGEVVFRSFNDLIPTGFITCKFRVNKLYYENRCKQENNNKFPTYKIADQGDYYIFRTLYPGSHGMLDSDKIKIIESTAEKKFIFTGFTTDSLRIDALPVTILTVTLSIFMLIMGIKIRKNIRKRRIDGFE